MPTPINISASRSAAILGQSSYSTPVQAWLQIMESREPGFCERRGYTFPVFEYNSAMKWGHAFESAIVELAEKKLNDVIGFREKYFCKPISIKHFEETLEPDILTCHIDGQYAKNVNVLHEGKTTSYFYFKDNFGEPGTDEVPIEYQLQCQHQMICTGAEKVILSVLVFPKRVEEWEEMGWEIATSGETYYIRKKEIMPYFSAWPKDWAFTLDQMGYFHQYEIKPNPELQSLMLMKYADFWNNYVLKGIEPPVQSYDDVKALCPNPVGTIIASEEIERLVTERDNIKDEIGTGGQLAKRAEMIKVSVLDFMRKEGAVVDDESSDKFILKSRSGKNIATYGKNKNGVLYFK
jgi:predicted phage-related endonuclease